MREFRSNEHSGNENPLNLHMTSQLERAVGTEADEDNQASVSDLQDGEVAEEDLLERHSNDLSLVDIPSMVEI